jgi:serine/threonine protein kinase
MTFPIISDYKTALKNSANRFASLGIIPKLDDSGEPVFMAGNFAVVFKASVGDENEEIAVKCFTRDLPNLEERHRAIAETVTKAGASHFIDISFFPDEIFVTSTIAPSDDYPVVTMPWIEGDSLGAVVARLCAKEHEAGLAALGRAWANLCLQLLNAGIAHGDLKHDNVLVTPDGQFKLIDYDSMYVAPLKNLDSIVLGGASYQHPGRTTEHFNKTLDHFSMLVVLLSLRALSQAPELFETYNTGENLILTHDDFISGGRSALLKTLRESPDAPVRNLTGVLIKACQSKSIVVPGMVKILKSARSK